MELVAQLYFWIFCSKGSATQKNISCLKSYQLMNLFTFFFLDFFLCCFHVEMQEHSQEKISSLQCTASIKKK